MGEEKNKKIEEKGLPFPSESMIMAGALERETGDPQPSMQISKMQATPAAESTRISLRTSTVKREKSLTSEQLLDLEQSEQYRQELKQAEESMHQACLEKSNSESQEAEFIKFRALKAQKEFWNLEKKRFEELMEGIEIKNAIAEKIYQNKSLVVTSSEKETEVTKEYEEYKKESKRLMDFCKRVIDKRGKREEYEELKQPQGVPDVKPISKKELDEKIREALLVPKEAQNLGENTIPPQYSREISR